MRQFRMSQNVYNLSFKCDAIPFFPRSIKNQDSKFKFNWNEELQTISSSVRNPTKVFFSIFVVNHDKEAYCSEDSDSSTASSWTPKDFSLRKLEDGFNLHITCPNHTHVRSTLGFTKIYFLLRFLVGLPILSWCCWWARRSKVELQSKGRSVQGVKEDVTWFQVCNVRYA